MGLIPRIVIITSIVTIALVTHCVLTYGYLDPADELPPGKLGSPLESFPSQLGEWVGEDKPVDDETMKTYPDEYVHRTYKIPGTQHQLMLWMAYSTVGKDRDHHPEVCYAVQGLPEDPDARKEIEVPGHEVPVQQFRFGYAPNYQLVYYWHYELPTQEIDQLNEFQTLYHAMRHRPASITIEVFAQDRYEEDAARAIDFVEKVDAELQSFLGPGAKRGSDRREVKILNAEH